MAQLKDLLVTGAARLLNGLNLNGDLTIAGNLLPATTETYNIGDSTHKWLQTQTKLLSVGAGDITSTGYEAVISGDLHITGTSLFDDYVQVGGARPSGTSYKFYVNGTSYFNNLTYHNAEVRMVSESPFTAYMPRKKTDGGGWAYDAFRVFDASSNTFARFGVYGGADSLTYIYIGANSYESTNNLLINSSGNIGLGVAPDASYKLKITGNTFNNGIIYFGNGTTYYIDNSANANLSTVTVPTSSGFNYSGIESASADSSRVVWFAHSSKQGTPVYNTKFKYNPATDTLTVGNVTGNAATALTSSAGSSTVPIYFAGGKPVQCSTTLGISITGSAAKWTTARTISLSSDAGGSASIDGSANVTISTTVNRLTCYPTGRPSSGNLNLYSTVGNSKMTWMYSSSSMTTGYPSTGDGVIINGTWDWGGYGCQFSFSNGGHASVRGASNVDNGEGNTPRYSTSWGDWHTILDSSNYTSYTVTKTGSGASGTWGISITGNAATASATVGMELTTIQKTLTVSNEWIDTGIQNTSLSTGTYVVQLYGFNSGVQGIWGDIFSGVMSWYSDQTNSTDYDEILLHSAGHATNASHIYLRTIRSANTDSRYLRLQIKGANTNTTATTITFKFRRII